MLRNADEGDREAIRRWRNHPRVRAASFTTHEIGRAEHLRWWLRILADPAYRVLVFELHGVPAGVVNLHQEPGADTATWGFFFDNDGLTERGELEEACAALGPEVAAYAFEELGLRALRGEVLADNRGSLRLHHAYGFRETGSEVREFGEIRREVITVELAAPTPPAREAT